MNKDCLFCKIIKKEVPTQIRFENEFTLAFDDINPQAPTHILIIPKVHISTLNDVGESYTNLVGEIVKSSSIIAKKIGIETKGYRTVFNCNQDAGQTIFHIHLHLLGGRALAWPPG